jgi:hypothetical protein
MKSVMITYKMTSIFVALAAKFCITIMLLISSWILSHLMVLSYAIAHAHNTLWSYS